MPDHYYYLLETQVKYLQPFTDWFKALIAQDESGSRLAHWEFICSDEGAQASPLARLVLNKTTTLHFFSLPAPPAALPEEAAPNYITAEPSPRQPGTLLYFLEMADLENQDLYQRVDSRLAHLDALKEAAAGAADKPHLNAIHLVFIDYNRASSWSRRWGLADDAMLDSADCQQISARLTELGMSYLQAHHQFLGDFFASSFVDGLSCSYLKSRTEILPYPRLLFSDLGLLFHEAVEMEEEHVYRDELCDYLFDYCCAYRRPDLQVTIMGADIDEELYTCLARSLEERWPIRYAPTTCATVDVAPVMDGRTVRVESRQGKKINSLILNISWVSRFDLFEVPSQYEIASRRLDALKDLLIWLVPEAWLTAETNDLIEQNVLYHWLLSIGQLYSALAQPEMAKVPVLHFIVCENKSSIFQTKPWPDFQTTSSARVREELGMRAPKLLDLLLITFADIRFNKIPLSTAGDHLDYMPRWIDHLLMDALPELQGALT